MGQTLAILVDAYRDLNSRKMFWISLVLTTLGVAAFAILSLDREGLHILKWTINDVGRMKPVELYKSIFIAALVDKWLTWAATILALISTAGIFPDFISGGSVDLYLSKPISRLRLFATKYVTGLLFVTLQVSLFSVAAYFVMGWRAGLWIPGVFLAIPIVVCFFSYLFSVCVVIGIWTRSTIAALLLTLLFWLVVGLVAFADEGTLLYQFMQTQAMVGHESAVKIADAEIARGPAPERRVQIERRRETELKNMEEARERLGVAGKLHRIFHAAIGVFPKTGETIRLLNRIMLSDEEAKRIAAPDVGPPPKSARDSEAMAAQHRAAEELTASMRGRTLSWVLGTSFAFEGVMVLLGAWMFVRRDY